MLESEIFKHDYIYIVGKMCSGKSTLASKIADRIFATGKPVFRYALASPIKTLDARNLMSIALSGIVGDDEIERLSRKARKVLTEDGQRAANQFIGNDVIRKMNPSFFERYAIESVFNKVASAGSHGLRPTIIVDDVRWPSSLKILPRGVTIRVVTPRIVKVKRGCDLSGEHHSSELEVDLIAVDYEIVNASINEDEMISSARRVVT